MNHPDPVTRTRTIAGPRTLLEMCLDLRMAHNGSADPISEEETAAALAYLNYRLATWKPSVLPSGARFDECVRALVLATIIEVQCHQTERARVLGLPEIRSPITDAAIDAAKPDLLGRRVRIARNPEHDRLFDPLHRAALDGTVAKVDAQDATGAYHVTTDDDTQWGWFRPDELTPWPKTLAEHHGRIDYLRSQACSAELRLMASLCDEKDAIARGARVDGDEMVWPDGERYSRRPQ